MIPLPPHCVPAQYPLIPPGRFGAQIVRAGDAWSGPGTARVALLGLPDDTGVVMNHGRPGAREGPHAIRNALGRYGVAGPGYAEVLCMPGVVDAGDVQPGRSLDETHARITEAAETLFGHGLIVVGLGGGHDLTYPLVRASCRARSVRAGLYVDAHLDVRPEPGSGMAFRALVEQCGLQALGIVGYNALANSREHRQWFQSHGGRVLDAGFSVESAQRQIVDTASGAAAFVSIDLDAIDSSQAPGVSALNPDGLTVGQVAMYARAAGRTPAVQCFDLMELNPAHDPDHRTARVAAHLLLHFLIGVAERPAA
jgi:formimidoylglutamase